MNEQMPISTVAAASSDEPRFSEQGICVFQVSDYEWVAARTRHEAVDFACEAWGYKGADAARRAEADGAFEIDGVACCDLDANSVTLDADEGARITYRESLREHIAKGDAFPLFFAFCE